MKITLISIVLTCGLWFAAAQNLDIPCNFLRVNDVYTCWLSEVTVVDNENANIVFGGVHHPGHSNADVTYVLISSSSIPFIMTQMFTTFPFVSRLYIQNGGLTRIQQKAFSNASHLWRLQMHLNQELRTIPANAFMGASNLYELDLFNNNIETIHESGFNGLSFLDTIFLDNNVISHLPVNVFSQLSALQNVFFSSNKLSRIDGQLFSNNPLMNVIDFQNNQINAIDRTLFDTTPRLLILNLIDNICASNLWVIVGPSDWQVVRGGLSQCFDNFDATDDVKRFILQLRGSFKIKYENGTTIVTI